MTGSKEEGGFIMSDVEKARQLIHEAEVLTVLTGAGVSTPSGIPDYRSLTGVYHGLENPEYLLSHTCLMTEPDKFYNFNKSLYHPEAEPNVIHRKLKQLEADKTVNIITQNIDQLHHKAGSTNVVDFHGNLYDCYCTSCGASVPVEEYLESYWHHECDGLVRPNVVLYEEGLSQEAISRSVQMMTEAELVMIAGTSFQVVPFSTLIQYKRPDVPVVVVNREPIYLFEPHLMVTGSAEDFFEKL